MSIRSFLEVRGVDYNSLSPNSKFYAFIGQLVDRGTITIEQFHEYFGKRNNIPECCIQFFIENRGNDPYTISLDNGQPTGLVDYAMCPKCIKEHHDRRD